MTLHQLRIFSSVAKFLSVTRAAGSLDISQPSVSQQLKLLEEEFHVKLYEKVGQGVRLTRAGLDALKKIEPILFQLDELAAYLQEVTAEKPHATLTVGTSYGNAETWLPQVLSSFREIHPAVRVHVHADRSAIVEDAILDEQVEVGFIYVSSYHPSLSYISLGTDKVAFVASKSDPLIQKDELTLDEVSTLPIVVQKPRAGGDIPTTILDHLRKQGFSPNIVMQCDSINSVRAAVIGGAGMGFMIENTATTRDNRLREVRVRDFMSFSVEAAVAYRRDRVLSKPAKRFLELVRDLYAPSAKR